MRKFALILCGAAILAAGTLFSENGWGQPPIPGGAANGLSGRRAPSFALPDHAMKQFDILDYRGRWLLLDFTRATDCAKCKQLTKILEQLKPRLGAKVAILAIVDPPENLQTVGKYIGETKTTIPFLFDSGQTAMWYYRATPQNPAIDSPHLFAINPQGMMVKDWNDVGQGAPGFGDELVKLVSGPGDAK
jgi:peroxiredoxin